MSEQDYWSKSSDEECGVFFKTMSWNYFEQIKSYLIVADNPMSWKKQKWPKLNLCTIC